MILLEICRHKTTPALPGVEKLHVLDDDWRWYGGGNLF